MDYGSRRPPIQTDAVELVRFAGQHMHDDPPPILEDTLDHSIDLQLISGLITLAYELARSLGEVRGKTPDVILEEVGLGLRARGDL